MEKKYGILKMYKIVISGPESTGKTDLARFLSHEFGVPFYPEYAREYILELGRPYTYEDLEHIARVQWEQFREYSRSGHRVLVLDTFLVITRIWFKEVYGQVPGWTEFCLGEAGIDLYLLCYPDLEWIPDSVRENPGARRLELFEMYRREIRQLGTELEVIRGRGQERYSSALEAILAHNPKLGE